MCAFVHNLNAGPVVKFSEGHMEENAPILVLIQAI